MALSSQVQKTGTGVKSTGRGSGRMWFWFVLPAAVLMVSITGIIFVRGRSPAANMVGTTVESMGPVSPREGGGVEMGVATTQPVAVGGVGVVASTQPATSQPATTQPAEASTAPEIVPQLKQGLKLIEEGKLLDGRALLSDLYTTSYAGLDPRDAQAIRDALSSINQELVFGKKVTAGDVLTEMYEVKAGDLMTKIARQYKTPVACIVQVNGLASADRIRAGEKLKVVRGPFHAIVHKDEYRMDIFLKTPAPEEKSIYVRSFFVGLGSDDSTPEGMWMVTPQGKLTNPGWTNPRTHQTYGADDPANPIGEYWIGLTGTDENTKGRRGYGIHGTVEPESIGRMMSMGCVRLRADDIAQVYKLLTERYSTVVIGP